MCGCGWVGMRGLSGGMLVGMCGGGGWLGECVGMGVGCAWGDVGTCVVGYVHIAVSSEGSPQRHKCGAGCPGSDRTCHGWTAWARGQRDPLQARQRSTGHI